MIHTGLGVFVKDTIANANYAIARRREIKKYKDPRRVSIAAQYPLTSEQREKVDALYLDNYGEKIPYVWHQNYAAHSGKFDERYFPEHLFIPEFEAFQNQNSAAVQMIGDKNFLPVIANSIGVRMPRTFVSCTNGVLRDRENHLITDSMANDIVSGLGVCFVKPTVGTNSGQGCLKVNKGSDMCFTNNSLIVNGNGGGINRTLSFNRS